MYCIKCNSEMVEVKIVDRFGCEHIALVCTHCGYIKSNDSRFKRTSI